MLVSFYKLRFKDHSDYLLLNIVAYTCIWHLYLTKSNLFFVSSSLQANPNLFWLISIFTCASAIMALILRTKNSIYIYTVLYTLADFYMYHAIPSIRNHFNKIILYTLWANLIVNIKPRKQFKVAEIAEIIVSVTFVSTLFYKFSDSLFTWENYLKGNFEIIKAINWNSPLKNILLEQPLFIAIIKSLLIPLECLIAFFPFIEGKRRFKFLTFVLFHISIYMLFKIVMFPYIVIWAAIYFPIKDKDDII